MRSFVDQDPLKDAQLLELVLSAENSRPPGHTQVNRESGFCYSVSGDVSHDHVHGRVLCLHNVVEITAQQRTGPTGYVT